MWGGREGVENGNLETVSQPAEEDAAAFTPLTLQSSTSSFFFWGGVS